MIESKPKWERYIFQNDTFPFYNKIIFVSVVACVLCYTILYWLLNYIDGHKLALFDGLHTISATVFGLYFFNESLNSWMIFGGALLLGGLVLGNLSSKTADRPPAVAEIP